MGEQTLTVGATADQIADQTETDILLYNGCICRPFDKLLIDACQRRCLRKNVLLILVTEGGDADAAYRMARCLQDHYERFTLVVSGVCKGAGTLVALGAHELVFSEHGEIGPLDVQVSSKDSLRERQSGLVIMSALTVLQEKARSTFEAVLLETQRRGAGAMSLRLAAEVAADLTTGLFAPLYAQVDSVHVAAAGRALSVAEQYGRRLSRSSKNFDLDVVDFLISKYPSRDFVIDYAEGNLLFRRIRKTEGFEAMLLGLLDERAITPLHREAVPFEFLAREPKVAAEVEGTGPDAKSEPPSAPGGAGYQEGADGGETMRAGNGAAGYGE